jgi:hypothetical protein
LRLKRKEKYCEDFARIKITIMQQIAASSAITTLETFILVCIDAGSGFYSETT